jgi:uncharacterized protein YcbK (DUF882 family)
MKKMRLSRNFALNEFNCRDGSTPPPDIIENLKKLAVNLEVLRVAVAKAITVNSGYRSPAYNAKVGGKVNSQHLKGTAADIVVEGYTPKQLAAVIDHLIKTGLMKEGGLGIYPTFVHYDTRGTRARW